MTRAKRFSGNNFEHEDTKTLSFFIMNTETQGHCFFINKNALSVFFPVFFIFKCKTQKINLRFLLNSFVFCFVSPCLCVQIKNNSILRLCIQYKIYISTTNKNTSLRGGTTKQSRKQYRIASSSLRRMKQLQ